MLERPIIQQRGFRNATDDTGATGFQLQLRNPNYRGIAGSLVDGADVMVDGHYFPVRRSAGRCRAAPSPSTNSAPPPTYGGSSTSPPRSSSPTPAV